jgi:biopolymer transport protein ExbD
MAKVPKEADAAEGFSLTPMIDVTFQLLIFFMLVSDMSQSQIELLTLPIASKAIKEKFADETMLVLNVLPDGKIKVQGKLMFNPDKEEDPKKLEDLFESRRQQRKYQEIPGKDDLVRYPVMLRCDRSTEFQHLQRILMIATKHGGVTKIQLGAKVEGEQ